VKPPACILVVEDDHAIRESIAELLADEGYTVACAANGAEALDLLLADTRPNLILLDLMMPVMDGWAFRSAQKKDPRLAGIPVLVLSAGYGRDSMTLAGLGVDGFLAKPFDREALVSSVLSLC
jgi:CheY-like chemotaxis protein